MTSELPPLVGGRYRPIRELGRGGMGIVYEVEHVHTGERLALKVLVAQYDPTSETAERFKREARVSAQIRSEHVVRITDADVLQEMGNTPYVVMELLEGADLEKHCGQTPQPPELVVGWLRQVARALDRAHRLGIVHRDLKPANIFLTQREDGSWLVKVLDFGIAKMMFERGATTAPGAMLGTPMYMSPEQASSSAELSGATDRHALGLIAYRMLTGETYFRGDSMVQIVNELVYAPMVPPSERAAKALGPAFDGWFARACARDPSARFASAAEQIEALAEALQLPRREIDPTVTLVSSTPPPQSPTSSLATSTPPADARLRITPGSDSPLGGLDRLALTRTQREPTTSRRLPPRARAWAAIAIAALFVLAVSATLLLRRAPPEASRAAARDAEPALSTILPPSPPLPVLTAAGPSATAPALSAAPLAASRDAGAIAHPAPSRGKPDPRPARSVDPFGDQL